MMDGVSILRRYVNQRIAARERDRERAAEAFAKEVEIYAAPYLARILPPEFTITFNHSVRFNKEYVEIQPHGPTAAKLIIKGASKELYIARTEFGSYNIFAYVRCNQCGEQFHKLILTPEELLAAIEGDLQPPSHRCKTLNTRQPAARKIFPSEVNG